MILSNCQIFSTKPWLLLCEVEEFVLFVSWLPFASSCWRWAVKVSVSAGFITVLPGARSTLHSP